MPITNKKPARKQSVGALYYDFATDIEVKTYAATPVKSEVVKTISTTEMKNQSQYMHPVRYTTHQH